MDVINNTREIADFTAFLDPPDLAECEEAVCKNCQLLKDRLKKLSYCLAVAQRLSDVES
jgi:hypothetical protein